MQTRRAIEQLFRDGNRDAIVGELCAHVSREEAEDLVQRSVERALAGRCQAEHVGAVHLWIRQDARFALSHLLDWRKMSERRLAYEGATLPRPNELPSADDGLAQETSVELANELVQEAQLNPVDRELVRLYWGERLPRKQVAGELGMPEGTLKKRLAKAGAAFEQVLVRRCGGGCGGPEEQHVRAYAFQHTALSRGNVQGLALSHLEACDDCNRLFSQLEQVRLAVAGMAPLPLALDDRPVHAAARAADAFPRVWDRLSVVPRSLRHWAADLKAQALCNCSRAAEIAPVTTMRPGAGAAALVTTCLATIGGGVYCVGNSVDPTAGLVSSAVHQVSHHKAKAKAAPAKSPSAQAAAAAMAKGGSAVLTPPPAKTTIRSASATVASPKKHAKVAAPKKRHRVVRKATASQREFEPSSAGGTRETTTTPRASTATATTTSSIGRTPTRSVSRPAYAAPQNEFAP